jgi:hypothetical protein
VGSNAARSRYFTETLPRAVTSSRSLVRSWHGCAQCTQTRRGPPGCDEHPCLSRNIAQSCSQAAPFLQADAGAATNSSWGGGELPSCRTIACLQQDVRVMEKVLTLGLDINGTTTDKGLSPLHLATQNDNEELFMMLLEHGASP